MRGSVVRRGALFLLTVAAVIAPALVAAQDEGATDQPLSPLDGTEILVTAGEEFEARVRVERVPAEEVRVRFPTFPAGFESAGNPTLVTRGLRSMEVRIPMVARRPGWYVLEGIEIVTPVERSEIAPILVGITAPGEETVPFRARWRVPDAGNVQSQSIPIVLEIVGATQYVFPDEITYRAPETGLFEEVGGLGEVSTRDVSGRTIYDIPVASFLFTPATAGEVAIPEARVAVAGQRAVAAAVTIPIEPLPETAVRTNAVGTFRIDSTVGESVIDSGSTVSVEIVVTGVGNFPVLDMPTIEAPDFQEVDRNESVVIEADPSGIGGYRGERRRTVTLEHIGESVDATITIGPYTYFDDRRRETVTLPADVYRLDVVMGTEDERPDRAVPDLPLLSQNDLAAARWYRLADVPWLLYAFLIGPAVFAVIALWSVRHGGSRRRAAARGSLVGVVTLLLGATLFPSVNFDRLRTAADAIDEGRFAVAGVLYDLEIAEAGWHAGLHYNRGVLGLRTERPVVATYHLRRAVRLAPEREEFRQALLSASEYFGLDEQVGIPRYIRPDYFVLILVVLWTAFWTVLASRRRLRNTLSLVGLGMAIVVAIGGTVWSWNLDQQRDAVVREAVHVRRIPDSTAVPWIGLHQAQAVRIELEYESFYLVRTQSGMTGWIPQETVYTVPVGGRSTDG